MTALVEYISNCPGCVESTACVQVMIGVEPEAPR
jgi:hypothetical protein